MNKYEKFARQTAETTCEMMNLFCKKSEAEQFRDELSYSLRHISFGNKKWNLMLPYEKAKK